MDDDGTLLFLQQHTEMSPSHKQACACSSRQVKYRTVLLKKLLHRCAGYRDDQARKRVRASSRLASDKRASESASEKSKGMVVGQRTTDRPAVIIKEKL